MAPSGTELTAWARSCQISRDPRQQRLSEEWVAPVRDELVRSSREHRRRVDDRLRARIPERLADEGMDESRVYPAGFCRQIRDGVWETLSAEPLIRDLASRGLVWKRVYFICEGPAFQNAIQLGDWMIDAAHDTVDPAQEPVVVTPLDSVAHENIDGWERYAEVCETYHRVKLYPNFYFPLLFPLSPFVAQRSSGRVELAYFQNMIFLLDLGDQWRRARRLLADASWMGDRLPEPVENALARFAGESRCPVEFRRGGRGAVAAMLDEWDQIGSLPPAQRNQAVEYAQKVTVECARLLRTANVRP